MTIAETMTSQAREQAGALLSEPPIAVFERAGLELVVQDDTLVTVFRMRAPRQGNDMTFEIMKSDYGHDFATLLRRG